MALKRARRAGVKTEEGKKEKKKKKTNTKKKRNTPKQRGGNDNRTKDETPETTCFFHPFFNLIKPSGSPPAWIAEM
jgi:hypothetical protein